MERRAFLCNVRAEQPRSLCHLLPLVLLAVTFSHFVTADALSRGIQEAREREDAAFTTDDSHTAYLLAADPSFPSNSVRNYEMRTQVASIAFDELPEDSSLAALYRHPNLRRLVSMIVNDGDDLFLSDDPLGCCSINVFRPTYHHSFHFDESEFSTTLMLQEASEPKTGLFQYTDPFRRRANDDLALHSVAATLRRYCDTVHSSAFCEPANTAPPPLHTLKFTPGTLSIFSGSKSLHRVTRVEGTCSRLVAVLTFGSEAGFRNSSKVQKLFWGRSVP